MIYLQDLGGNQHVLDNNLPLEKFADILMRKGYVYLRPKVIMMAQTIINISDVPFK